MKLRLFLVFFLLCQSYLAFSDSFVVTSNADAGAGTLREALTRAAANGILVNDYINFNLPGNTETDRTILLQSELPLVSGHVILDATTQPGPNLGNSTAKIMIKANRVVYQSSKSSYGCFNIVSVTDVEIYGFAFDQFYSLILKTNPNGQSIDGNGIYIVSSSGITIGAPGKGNVFIQNGFGIYASSDENYQNTNGKVKVRSNWFGLNLDGSESNSHKTRHAQVVANDAEFGGPDLTYGNILGGYSSWGVLFFGTNVKVRFNRFGYIGDGTLGFRGVAISMNFSDSEFTDNQANRFAIEINNGKNVKVLRNKERAIPIQVLSQGISVTSAENVQIGSDDIADANEFLPADYGPFRNFASKNVEVRKNIIHCTAFAYRIRDDVNVRIQVLVNNDTEYSGTANPGSEVYIYNDNTDCPSCSPLQFYTEIIADPTGKWSIIGDFRNNKFVANATLINTSSEFSQPQILSGNSGYWYIKTDPTCGKSNGTLELAKTANVLKIEWYNSNDEKVGEGLRVENLPPGGYYAKGYNGKCYTLSPYEVTLFNIEPQFITTGLKIQQPGCGMKNGSIKGLYYSIFDGSTSSYKWLDENDQVVPTGNTDLNDVGPGSYTLVVTTQTNCTKSYGPIVLKNTAGPNINQSLPDIKGSSCNTPTGSIKNIQATGSGTLSFKWKNAVGQEVGNAAELLDVPAGLYTLEVKDDSSCPALLSTPIEVPEINGITINTANKVQGKATCNTSNGSITGVTVTGATDYKWLDAGVTVVANTLNLTGMPAGKYRLVASNAVCNKTSEEFTIELAQSTQHYASTKVITNAQCNQDNGKIEVIFTIDQPVGYRWQNSSGQTVGGNSRILEDMFPGAYDLYITDETGCEGFMQQYIIPNTAGVAINPASAIVTNDQCGLGTGRIKAPGLSRGQLPYFYEWKDQDGRVAGSEAILDRLKAGTYQLTIGDAMACSRQTISYTVQNESAVIPTPVLNDIKICSVGNAVIQVMNTVDGMYTLYNENGSMIGKSDKGVFSLRVSQTQVYRVILAKGTCESLASTVKVTIENDGIGTLANALSPNGDGVNDQWLIPGIASYPEATVAIFNRYGQKVFDATGYKTPFNGRMNGAELAVGTYYYIIDLKRGCGLQKGSLTIVR